MKRTFEINYNKTQFAPDWLTADNLAARLIDGLGPPSRREGGLTVREITDKAAADVADAAEMFAIARDVVAESLEHLAKPYALPQDEKPERWAADAERFRAEARRLRAMLEPAPNADCPGPCPYHNPLAWAEAQKAGQKGH